MKNLFILLLLIPVFLEAQEAPLDIFRPLENYVWTAEGEWGDGSKFRQEVEFEFSLGDKLVKVESKGFTNKNRTEFGARNHGIRQYDEKKDEIRFWEFDVFGSVTEGIVKSEGKNLAYKYDYGGTFVTEMWIFKNENNYGFIVGTHDGEKWTQKFLETEFKGKMKSEDSK